MKETYETPKMEIIQLVGNDIITDSTCSNETEIL